MSKYPRYTQQQVIDALVQAGGLKHPAAAALHCSRRTINRFIEVYPAVKTAYEDAIQDTIDVAQSKLMALVEREDFRAIHFLLSTLGKDRGFTERTEIQTLGGDLDAIRQQLQYDIARVYGDEDEE